MLKSLQGFFDAGSFIPHGHCYLWKPGLLSLHIASDSLIALAYFSILITLLYFVQKRQDFPFRWLILLFGTFIVSCGITHLMAVWTLWYPLYWLSGSLKAFTAGVSLLTAGLLIPLIPKALALPSTEELQVANKALKTEIAGSEAARRKLQKTEAALQKEREFLNALLDNLQEGIVACDANGILTLFNQATRKYHGLPAQAISPDEWSQYYDLYLPDGKTPMQREDIPLFRAFEGELVRDVEMILAPQGKPKRTLLASGQAFFDDQGNKLGAVVAMHDISDRKAAEDALALANEELELRVAERTAELSHAIMQLQGEIAERRWMEEERQKFVSLIENSNDFIGMATFTGETLFLNEAGRQLVGLGSLEETFSKKVPEYISDEVRATFLETVLPTALQQGIWEGETQLQHFKTGKPIDVQMTLFTVKHPESSEPFCLATVTRDITERKQVEAALKESEEQFRSLVSNLPGAIYRCACDADWTIDFISDGIEDISGYPASDFIQKVRSCASIIHPEDTEMVERLVQQALEKKQPYILEFRVIASDGSVKWVSEKGQGIFTATGELLYLDGAMFDISDRKAAEEALRTTQERLQHLLAYSPVVIYSASVSGNPTPTFISENVTAQMGFLPEEFLEDSGFWANHLHPEDAPRIFAEMKQVLEQEHQSLEYRFLFKDGAYHWMHDEIKLVRDKAGNVQEVVGCWRDITESKEAEARLQQATAELARSEAELRQQTRILELVLNSMGDGVVVVDETGKFLIFNPAAQEMVGLGATDNPPDEWSATYGLFLPDGCTPYPSEDLPLTRTMRGEAFDDVEVFVCHPGKLKGVWLKVNGRPLLDESGILRGGAIVCRNVTSDKQAQQRLKQLAKEQKSLLKELKNRQNALDEAAIVSETDLKGTITFINDKFCQVSGYNCEELIGQNHRLINSEEHSQSLFQNLWDTISQGRVWKGEIKNKRKDGSFYWVDTTVAPIFDINGKIVKYISIRFDITERKQAEEALLASNRKVVNTLESITDAFFALNHQWQFTYLNQQAEQLLKRTQTELLGKSIWDEFPEAVGSTFYNQYHKSVTQQISITFEEFYPPLDGWFEVRAYPSEDGLSVYFHDITERKQAEEKLQQTTALQQAILNSTNYLIVATTAEGIVNIFNDSAERLLGYTAAEVVGKITPAIWHDKEEVVRRSQQLSQELGIPIEPGFETFVAKARSHKSYDECEWSYIRKDGSRFPVLLSVTALRDSEGNITGFVGIGNDITERKQAEAELRQLTTALENAVDGISLLNPQGRYISVNRAYASPAGYEPEEILGMEWLLTVHPDEQEKMMVVYQQMLRDGKVEAEAKGIRKDGSIFYKQVVMISAYDEQGQFIGHHCFMKDISDRKQAEAQLQQTAAELARSEAELRQQTAIFELILNSMGDGVIVADEQGQFLIFNPAAEEMFGSGSTDTTPSEWSATYGLFLPDAVTPYPQDDLPLARAIKGEYIDDLDMFVRHAGTPEGLWAKINGRPLLDDEEVLRGGVIVCRNVTNDKEAEAALRRSEAQLREQATQLEQTLRELRQTQTQLVQTEKMSSLGQLVAGVAHEINNPVNFIYGNVVHANEYTSDLLNLVELYQEYYPEPAPAIQAEVEAIDLDFIKEDLPNILTSMKVGADRIRQIVLSLRNFSRLDEAEMKAVDIHEGLDNTLLILQNRLKAKPDHPGIQVIKEYGKLPLVECYAGQLNQVFMNILANAIDALDECHKKHRAEFKKASVETVKNYPSMIKIRTEVNDSNEIEIRVADNGTGMTESVCARLFDPFFTTKPVGQGTGLGMSISYQIVVEKHRGQLLCSSEPDKGTEFLIQIPIRR